MSGKKWVSEMQWGAPKELEEPQLLDTIFFK